MMRGTSTRTIAPALSRTPHGRASPPRKQRSIEARSMPLRPAPHLCTRVLLGCALVAPPARAALCDEPLENIAFSTDSTSARVALSSGASVYVSDDQGARWTARTLASDAHVERLWVGLDGAIVVRQEAARSTLTVLAPDGSTRSTREISVESMVDVLGATVALAEPAALRLSRDAGRTFSSATLPTDRTLVALGPRPTDVLIEPDGAVRLLRTILPDEDDPSHGWTSATVTCRLVRGAEQCAMQTFARGAPFGDRAAMLVPGGGWLAHEIAPTLMRFRPARGAWSPLDPSPRSELDGAARNADTLAFRWHDGAVWALDEGRFRTLAAYTPAPFARIALDSRGQLWALSARSLSRWDRTRWTTVFSCPQR